MLKNKFKQSGIYCIKNLKSGKVYIGSSQDLSKRKREHFNDLKRNKHHCYHLQKSYNTYGCKYFLFCVIEYIQDIKKLLKREQYWILYYGGGDHTKCYNTVLVPTATIKGLKFSDEARFKMSQSRKGRKFTESHKKHLSESNRGQKRTIEQRKHMSEGNLKRGFTEAQRAALKKRNDTYKGSNNPNAKKVICLENGKIFNTIGEALKFSGGKNLNSLSRQCKRHSSYYNKHYLLYKEYIELSAEEISYIMSL